MLAVNVISRSLKCFVLGFDFESFKPRHNYAKYRGKIRQDAGWVVVRGRRGNEICCRYCAVALHYWSGDVVPEPLSASLEVTLRLESSVLGCLRGEPPDPFWVGPLDAEAFMDLAAELLTFLSQHDRQGVWTLADH